MPLIWNNQAALDARYVLKGSPGTVDGGILTFTAQPGTTLESNRVNSCTQVYGKGVALAHDSATHRGGQTAGIAVSVARATPAGTFNNEGTGDSLQAYAASLLAFRVTNLGGVKFSTGGSSVNSDGISILSSPASGSFAVIKGYTAWGLGSLGGYILDLGNAVGPILQLTPDGKLNWGAGASIANLFVGTVGAAGGASALPAFPSLYMILNVNGTDYKAPLYAS